MVDVVDYIAAAVVAFILLIWASVKCKCCTQVSENETRVIEKFGVFQRIAKPGILFYMPLVNRLKEVKVKYSTADQHGHTINHRKVSNVISLQNEVLDFPKQAVITRDNAKIYIDAIMQYRISDPYKMVYSVFNLPNMLSRLLQSHLRDVAGSLDVDRIIEDTSILDRVSGDLAIIARNWGVNIDMVKIQRVQADTLAEVLQQKTNADLKNREIIISANTTRRTQIIDAEGNRDKTIREAEGEAQRIVAHAKGQAQAILNEAQSEARSIQEISRSLSGTGDDPSKYLMALKFINVLKNVCNSGRTKVYFVPKEVMMISAAKVLGVQSLLHLNH